MKESRSVPAPRLLLEPTDPCREPAVPFNNGPLPGPADLYYWFGLVSSVPVVVSGVSVGAVEEGVVRDDGVASLTIRLCPACTSAVVN